MCPVVEKYSLLVQLGRSRTETSCRTSRLPAARPLPRQPQGGLTIISTTCFLWVSCCLTRSSRISPEYRIGAPQKKGISTTRPFHKTWSGKMSRVVCAPAPVSGLRDREQMLRSLQRKIVINGFRACSSICPNLYGAYMGPICYAPYRPHFAHVGPYEPQIHYGRAPVSGLWDREQMLWAASACSSWQDYNNYYQYHIIYTCVQIYIYIYIERERDTYRYVDIYIYIHTYIHTYVCLVVYRARTQVRKRMHILLSLCISIYTHLNCSSWQGAEPIFLRTRPISVLRSWISEGLTQAES